MSRKVYNIFPKFAPRLNVKSMKRINITTVVLLIYLIVISIIGWPGKYVQPDYVKYFCTIGITLVVIFFLRFIQIKRFKMREKAKKEKE